MKLAVVCLLLIFTSSHLIGQKNAKEDVFYLWDSAWNNVPKIEKARFFTRVRYVSDTCWQHYNYKIGGPMITLEEYRDRDAKIPNGRFSYMNPGGTLDSIGHVLDGKLHGTWYFFSDTASILMTKKYASGKLISTWKASDKNNDNKQDSVKEEGVESMFPGNAGSWSRYLLKNMRYPQSAIANKIQGSVIVNFIIDTEGKVQEEFLLRSVEFTIDDEAIRLIKNSPKWIPAKQHGNKVKSYKQQPIVFRLE